MDRALEALLKATEPSIRFQARRDDYTLGIVGASKRIARSVRS